MVGHTALQRKAQNILINIGGITDDITHTLKNFESISKNALKTMQEAYTYLKHNKVAEAFRMFDQIKTDSEEMCKISDALSKKCIKESTEINDLRVSTSKEKETIKAQKENTDKLASQNRVEKTYQEEIKKDSDKKVDKKEQEVAVISDNEEKIMKKKEKLREKTEYKLSIECQNLKKDQAALKSKYDADDSKITTEMKNSEVKFENGLLANEETYKLKLEEVDAIFKEKIKSAEDAHQMQIKQNEKEFQEAKRENNRLYENRLEEYKEKYDKSIFYA